MPRVTTPLTDTQIKNTKPKPKEFNLVDGGGLALRIKPSGSKLWVFNYYKPFTKKRTNIGIGPYPEITLSEARKTREQYKALLAKKTDPKDYREQLLAKEEEAYLNTFECIAERWLSVKRTTVSEEHAEDIWRSLELHIFPSLGNIPIHKISAQKTIKTISPVANNGSLETVKRLCQRLNEIFTFAVNSGLIEHNAIQGISKAFAPPKKSNYKSLAPDEIPDLIQAISNAKITITTRCLLYWQLHTMVRPGEAVATKWNEIDFANNLWNIPAERMKKKRPHSVPLSKESLRILETMQSISGHREYVFPSNRSPRAHANASTPNMALKRMGYKGKLVAHGFRALASTTLNDYGFDPDIIESALAHVEKNETRRAYNRAEYLERRKKMMDWWSAFIEGQVNNKLNTSVKKFPKRFKQN